MESDKSVSDEKKIMDAMAEHLVTDLAELDREMWFRSLAEEAGVLPPDPTPPPIPEDHPCCPMCRERGQIVGSLSVPWDGSESSVSEWRLPDCAFRPLDPEVHVAPQIYNETFRHNNYDCAALSRIRGMAEEREVWSEDEHAAVLPWDGRFLVVSYFKHRGYTNGLWVLDEASMRIATYQDVVRCLRWDEIQEAQGAEFERDRDMEAQLPKED